MFDDIEQKIDYEYEKWANFIYTTTTPDYLSRAFEIAAKRAMYHKIKEKLSEFTCPQITYVMKRQEFLDYMYLKCFEANYIILTNGGIDDDTFKRMLEITIK